MAIDEPFEYLSFGGTFSRSFQIWLDRFDFFSSIAGVVLVPFVVLLVSSSLLTAIWVVEAEEIPDFKPHHVPLVIFIFGLQFMIYELATILGRAAMMRGVAKMYVGQSVTLMECLQEAWAKKGSLISVAMIVGLAWTLSITVVSMFLFLMIAHMNPLTIFLFVVTTVGVLGYGLYAYIGVVLTYPAIMIENCSGPIHGLKRSWDLATGSRCYLLCVLFCLWFLNSLINRVLHNIFLTGDIMDALFSLAGLVVTVVPLLVYVPLQSIMETVMYLNLRIGRESMNHQVLTGDLLSEGGLNNAARFRNDDYSGPTATTMTDYRHVPLMDQEDPPIVGYKVDEIA